MYVFFYSITYFTNRSKGITRPIGVVTRRTTIPWRTKWTVEEAGTKI